EYATPKGSAAAYYPETNPLVPLDSTAAKSNCPTSKAIVVSLTASSATTGSRSGGHQDQMGSDEGHKAHPQPHHLS
ncbi:MAG: hypothetical protein WA931_02005, partial [Rhodococcus sp. (in: high G+C Gram-positive bacteria)]